MTSKPRRGGDRHFPPALAGGLVHMATRLRQKSFDELPALAVRGRSLRHSLRLVTMAWMFGIVWMSLITGSQMTNFQRLMGFGYWSFGIMSAIPYAATLAQLVVAVSSNERGCASRIFIPLRAPTGCCGSSSPLLPVFFRPGPLAVAVFLTYLRDKLHPGPGLHAAVVELDGRPDSAPDPRALLRQPNHVDGPAADRHRPVGRIPAG